VVASWKISPSYRTGENRISCKYRAGRVIADTAGGMTRSMKDFDHVCAKLEVLSFAHLTIGGKSQAWYIQRVNVNRGPCDPFQFSGASNVIYMAVRDKNVPYFKTGFSYSLHDSKYLVTWINNKSFHCFFASEYIAIGLVWADGYFSEHEKAPFRK
jgi:hypothetical protein